MNPPALFQITSILAMSSMLLSACAFRGEANPDPSTRVAKSDQPRVMSSNVPEADIETLVAGNNSFALDLYQKLRTHEGNLFYSPYSISLALGMTYAGARSETEVQMADVLHFELPQARLHPAFNALEQELAERGETDSEDGQPLQLDIANAAWVQQTYPFQQEFLDLLARNYGAGIRLGDFLTQAESIRQDINTWVSDQTHGKIENLIPQGALDAMTRMVLVNAIYFVADWQEQFDPDSTSDAPFYLLDGSNVKVSMMSADRLNLAYSQGDGYQAIELPYQGGTAAMDILLPDKGEFNAFEASLDNRALDDILGAMSPVSARLRIPKYKFASEFNLSELLSESGMSHAFDASRADFSGMTGNRDLFISAVFHKAFVAVDEEGTEAAAATAVVMKATSAPMIDLELTIDRPFIFMIRDLSSGQILFVGRMTNPLE
jgi:serpin B